MIRLHNQNRTHTFIDVESGQFISLPKDLTDKPPVNADINNNIDTFHSTGGEGIPSEPIPLVNITEWNKTVCGKNILPDKTEHWEQGTLNSSTGESAPASNRIRLKSEYMIRIVPNTQITDSFISGYVLLAVHEYNISKQWIGRQAELSTVTVSENTHFVRPVVARADSGDLVPSDIEMINAQLELGNMSTGYQAYQGNTYPYKLEDVNGILHYGGDLPDGTADSVNWETGELIKRTKSIVLDGSESGWGLYGPDVLDDYIRFVNEVIITDDEKKLGNQSGLNGNALCSHFKNGRAWGTDTFDNLFSLSDTDTRIWFKIAKSELTGYSVELEGWQKLNLFKTWLGNNPVTVQYKLATPITYQIKQYGKTYGGVVWEYNEKPKSIQYHTNIFTDKNITMQCEVRKLGNRAMSEFYWVTETGDKITTEDGDYIMLEY